MTQLFIDLKFSCTFLLKIKSVRFSQIWQTLSGLFLIVKCGSNTCIPCLTCKDLVKTVQDIALGWYKQAVKKN